MSQQQITSRRPFDRQLQHHHSRHHYQPCRSPSHHQQPWVSRRMQHHQHHHHHRQCYRCGESFNSSHLSFCRARFVRCFSCCNFGHFSFMCANKHIYVSFVATSGSRRQNPCNNQPKTNNVDNNSVMIEPISEVMSLAQELPFATINQAALDPEIVSASDREYKLEHKLCAVLDLMEEDKILHSMEMLSILDRVTSFKEQLTKCEEEKTSISQEYERVKCRLEETSAETKSQKTECSKLREQIKNITTENTLSVNSVSKIEEALRQVRQDLEESKELLSKSREENDSLKFECRKHERDFSELCDENNSNVTQHNNILEELETLKKEMTHSVNSVNKSDNAKGGLGAETKHFQKTIAQLRDERDYFEERYETYAADNQRAVLIRLELEAEIKKLKKQQRNQYQQRNLSQRRN